MGFALRNPSPLRPMMGSASRNPSYITTRTRKQRHPGEGRDPGRQRIGPRAFALPGTEASKWVPACAGM